MCVTYRPGEDKKYIEAENISMVAKPDTVRIAAIFAVFATCSVAIPAFARDYQTPTWDTCYTLAVERGSGLDKGGGDKALSQNKAFMDQCMAGKIPLNPDTSASLVRFPASAHASR